MQVSDVTTPSIIVCLTLPLYPVSFLWKRSVAFLMCTQCARSELLSVLLERVVSSSCVRTTFSLVPNCGSSDCFVFIAPLSHVTQSLQQSHYRLRQSNTVTSLHVTSRERAPVARHVASSSDAFDAMQCGSLPSIVCCAVFVCRGPFNADQQM